MRQEEKELKRYFSGLADVTAAFLFGSRVKQSAGKNSDWDIGVYFVPSSTAPEWEETEKKYPCEDRIWDKLIDILKTDKVDLVVLNRAPSNIAAAIITEGVPLVIKDRGLFWDFALPTLRQAEDYTEFVESFYEISRRSASLSARDKERLIKIIYFMEQELAFAGYFAKFSFKDYQKPHKRRDVERWVENLVNSAIDSGEIVLASQKKKIPDYYKDIFIQLGLLPQFEGLAVEKFTAWVKLRNILAHEYLDIKWRKLEVFIKEGPQYLSNLLGSLKKCAEAEKG